MKRALALLRWSMAAVVASSATTVGPARADDPNAAAESLIQQGVEFRRLGQNREALDVFRRAYAVDPTPRAGAQAALARQALGDWVDAERGLAQALGASDDPWIATYRDALEQALAIVRAHLGWLVVETNVAQAEIRFEGDVQPLPDANPIRVPAHSLPIEIRAKGRNTVQRVVDVEPGARVSIFVALDPAPAGPTPAVVAGPAPVSASARLADHDDAKRRTLGAVAFAAAGTFAVGGVVSWRVHEDNVAVYNDDSRCRVGALTREQQCGGREAAANLALGFEIGSFAIAASTAALGAWEWWGVGRSRSTAVGSRCAPWAGLGVVCGGRF